MKKKNNLTLLAFLIFLLSSSYFPLISSFLCTHAGLLGCLTFALPWAVEGCRVSLSMGLQEWWPPSPKGSSPGAEHTFQPSSFTAAAVVTSHVQICDRFGHD